MTMRAFLMTKRLLDSALEWVVIIAMAALTLDVLAGVVIRYVATFMPGLQAIRIEVARLVLFDARGTDEMATTLMLWVALLGAALAFGEKSHLGVDYFVHKLDPAARTLAEIVVYVLVIVFALSVMLHGGYTLVNETLRADQSLPALGWKKGHVYLAVPISGAFIVLYAVEAILECLFGRQGPPMEERQWKPRH